MDELKKVLGTLGLAEDASADEAVSAVLRAKADAEVAATKLAATEAALASATAELETARTELAARDAARLAAEVDGLVDGAIGSGRIRPQLGEDGARIPTAVEKAIRDMAGKLGLDAAREYVESLPVLLPVGTGSLAEKTAPSKEQDKALIDDVQRNINAQLGIDDETFKRVNGRA